MHFESRSEASGIVYGAAFVAAPTGAPSASDGQAIADIMAEIGHPLRNWQRSITMQAFQYGQDGLYWADTVAMSISRQVGKTHMVAGWCFADCILNPGTTVIWTAHRYKVAREAFETMRGWANSPLLAQFIDPAHGVAIRGGSESITFLNGSRIIFAARERGAIRGFGNVRRLVLDEAQELKESAVADLLPTMNAAWNPQLIYMGTPPKPGDNAESFTKVRRLAREDDADRLLYVEYAADKDTDPDSDEALEQANPSYPEYVNRRALDRLRGSLSDEDYLREVLGRWDMAATSVISDELWGMAQDTDATPVSAIALAIDVAPDAVSASIAMAGQTSDGRWVVQVLDQRAGADWVPARLADLLAKNPGLHRAVMLDVGTAAQVIVEDLIRLKIKYTPFKVNEVGAAHQRFLDGLRDGSVVHVGQPQLTYAVGFARKRRINDGDMWAWNRKDNISDITPLVACTYALFGAQKQRVARPARGESRARPRASTGRAIARR